jgi:hypothetical protein
VLALQGGEQRVHEAEVRAIRIDVPTCHVPAKRAPCG